jgi:lysophospholipase L1-like esterase
VREELKLPKSARGDIKALMSIEERWFRRVTEDFLVMRRMITAYRTMTRTHQQLLNKYKALSEAEKVVLKPAISSIEKQMVEMARQIAEEVGKRYPAYNRLVGLLGINGNPSALEALAEVLVLPEWASWRRTKNYFGMWWRDRKTRFHRSRTARQALERLTISLKGYKIRGKELKEVLKTIWITLKAQKAGITAPA